MINVTPCSNQSYPWKKNQNKSLSDSKTLSDVKKTRRQLNYMFKVDNRNSRVEQRCEICSKLTIKIPWHHSYAYYFSFSNDCFQSFFGIIAIVPRTKFSFVIMWHIFLIDNCPPCSEYCVSLFLLFTPIMWHFHTCAVASIQIYTFFYWEQNSFLIKKMVGVTLITTTG